MTCTWQQFEIFYLMKAAGVSKCFINTIITKLQLRGNRSVFSQTGCHANGQLILVLTQVVSQCWCDTNLSWKRYLPPLSENGRRAINHEAFANMQWRNNQSTQCFSNLNEVPHCVLITGYKDSKNFVSSNKKSFKNTEYKTKK